MIEFVGTTLITCILVPQFPTNLQTTGSSKVTSLRIFKFKSPFLSFCAVQMVCDLCWALNSQAGRQPQDTWGNNGAPATGHERPDVIEAQSGKVSLQRDYLFLIFSSSHQGETQRPCHGPFTKRPKDVHVGSADIFSSSPNMRSRRPGSKC